ncbi:hypothetical protein U1Q18_017320 [Sarracenia purpurea var. burkii]
MDSIKEEKFEAMKNYKILQFLNNLTLYSLIALICALFCSSYPVWFPQLSSSQKLSVFFSLPNLRSFFFTPKCVFLVFNAIIVFLVGESKIANSHSSQAGEVYDNQNVETTTPSEDSTNLEQKDEPLELNFMQECAKKIEDKCTVTVQKEIIEEKEEDDDDEEEEKEEEGEEDDEECGLPTEELNKRVEDFIARVNRQRWVEGRLEDCGRG